MAQDGSSTCSMKSRGGSAWWSVGLIGSCFDQTLLRHPEVTGSNPVPDTITVDDSLFGRERGR